MLGNASHWKSAWAYRSRGGSQGVGCFIEFVVSFRCKRGKAAEKAGAELPVVNHRLLGKRLPLEVPLGEQGVFSRLPLVHLQMTEILPKKPCEPRQGGAGLFMNLVCGPEHCTIISSLCGRGRLFPVSDTGTEIISCADGQRWIYNHVGPMYAHRFQ